MAGGGGSSFGATPIGATVTPGGGVTKTVYTQLAFDPRINKQALLGGPITTQIKHGNGFGYEPESGLAHGFIVQAQSQATSDGALFGAAFLFNPSLVTLQHGIDSNSSLVLPQYRRLTADTGVYVIGLASTIDISLFYDRTYEVNTAVLSNNYYTAYSPLGYLMNVGEAPEGVSIAQNEDPRLIGAIADVNALYRVAGMTQPIPNVTWTNDAVGSQTATTSTTTVTGPMQQVPCYVMLGANMVSNTPFWYGYIDSIGVTYTHFTQAMVPMRAEVDLEITLLPTQS